MGCSNFDFKDISDDKCYALIEDMDYSCGLTIKADGVVQDITGNTYQMLIKDRNDGTILLDLGNEADTTVSGFYLDEPSNGHLFLTIINTDVTALGVGSFVYDIVETDTNSVKSLYMQGTVQVKARFT